MKGALGAALYGMATLGGSYLLLGKHLPRPAAPGPTGFRQVFHPCHQCATVTRHVAHSPACRTCQTCGHTTTPGDPQ